MNGRLRALTQCRPNARNGVLKTPGRLQIRLTQSIHSATLTLGTTRPFGNAEPHPNYTGAKRYISREKKTKIPTRQIKSPTPAAPLLAFLTSMPLKSPVFDTTSHDYTKNMQSR